VRVGSISALLFKPTSLRLDLLIFTALVCAATFLSIVRRIATSGRNTHAHTPKLTSIYLSTTAATAAAAAAAAATTTAMQIRFRCV
jgi:hypothetical protein